MTTCVCFPQSSSEFFFPSQRRRTNLNRTFQKKKVLLEMSLELVVKPRLLNLRARAIVAWLELGGGSWLGTSGPVGALVLVVHDPRA